MLARACLSLCMSYEIQDQPSETTQHTAADASANARKRDLALAKKLFDAGYWLLRSTPAPVREAGGQGGRAAAADADRRT